MANVNSLKTRSGAKKNIQIARSSYDVKKIDSLKLKDLEYLIEQKIMEILGDPDSGLEIKEEFKKELGRRLKDSSKRIPHQEVMKKFGQS